MKIAPFGQSAIILTDDRSFLETETFDDMLFSTWSHPVNLLHHSFAGADCDFSVFCFSDEARQEDSPFASPSFYEYLYFAFVLLSLPQCHFG